MKKRAKTSERHGTFPVAVLREQVSALEMAVAQVLAGTKREPIHELRKATRRIEAQLEVIAVLARQEPGFAAAAKPAERVTRLLRKVRRSAGAVRDLDAQVALAKEATAAGATRDVRREVKRLRLELKIERKHEARSLAKTLKAHALKLEPRLETLMLALQPVAEVGMSAVDLEVLTRGWYKARREGAAPGRGARAQLHGVRKAAKLARYMAENGAAVRVQQEFETLQDAGGRWHDALTLRDISREKLGRDAKLTLLLDRRESAARKDYRTILAD